MARQRKKSTGKVTSGVDWQEIRQRLDAAAAHLDRGPTPEERQDILKARAEALAREPRQDGKGECLDVLEFLLAHERYAIEMSWVGETIALRDLTSVPCTPPFVLGLVNVRGRIMSVVDIKRFFDLPEKGISDLNKVIIIRGRGMEFGILADTVCGVRSLPLAEVQTSLPTLTGIREEYLKGVTSERLVVLDGEKLITDGKIVVHGEIGD